MNEVKIIVTAQNQTFQEFERVRRHIAQINGDLDKLTKSLPDKLGGKTGQKAGEELRKGIQFGFKSFGDLMSAMPTELKVAGAAAGATLAAAMLPAIGATISAGVLAGLGGGAVAFGIKQAANDPAVQDAAGALGETISDHLKVLTTPFTQPTLEALDVAAQVWERNAVHLERAFVAGAKYVRPLTDAVASFANEVIPALARGVERAEPVIDAASSAIPKLGKAVASAFDDMTANADESAAALTALTDFISISIIGVGKFIGLLTEAFATTLRFGAAMSGWQEDFLEAIPAAGFFAGYMRDVNDEFERLLAIAEGRAPRVVGSVREIGSATDGLAQDTRRAAREVEALNKAFDDLFNRTMNVDKAAIRYQQAIDDLTETLRENGRTLDINTQKGRDNREAILDVVSAIEASRDAAIKAAQGSVEGTEAANRAYNKQLDALREQLRLLGYNKAEIDALINKYNILAQPLRKTITVTVVEQGGRIPARGLYAQAAGGITPAVPGYAGGGMVGGAGMIESGEYGRELGFLPPGTMMKSNAQSRTLVADALAGIGGWGGIGRSNVTLEVVPSPSAGPAFIDALIRELQWRVRGAGGGTEGVTRVFGGM